MVVSPHHPNPLMREVLYLKETNENYLDVFKDTSSIKVSINMETARFEDSINDNDEVAFFPPMTGG